MQRVNIDDPEAVIDAMYAAAFVGDIDEALRHCSKDAEWHPVTPTPTPVTLPIRAYFDLLAQLAADNPDYEILEHERHRFGNLVVTFLRTNLGQGSMTFRVVDGLVAEIWVINADGRDASGYF